MKTAKNIAASLTRQNIADLVDAVRSNGGSRHVDETLLSNKKSIHHEKGSGDLRPAAKLRAIMEVYV